MARYTGPKGEDFKKGSANQFGRKQKLPKKNYILDSMARPKRKQSEYAIQLAEKQNQLHLWRSGRRFAHTFDRATHKKGVTGGCCSCNCSSPVWTIQFIASASLRPARGTPVVVHKHIVVNGDVVNILRIP